MDKETIILAGSDIQGIRKLATTLLKKSRQQLAIVYERRMKGDKNPCWKGWYNLAHRRPNNGFPTVQMLDAIEFAIGEKW